MPAEHRNFVGSTIPEIVFTNKDICQLCSLHKMAKCYLAFCQDHLSLNCRNHIPHAQGLTCLKKLIQLCIETLQHRSQYPVVVTPSILTKPIKPFILGYSVIANAQHFSASSKFCIPYYCKVSVFLLDYPHQSFVDDC